MFERISIARQKRNAGFTLIELLIVIVILGILAAVVVFSVQGIQDRGQKAACKSDIATITTAEEANYAQSGSYATVDVLVTNKLIRTNPGSVTVDTTTGAVTPLAAGNCIKGV